jgi:hypothetical protein
MSDPCNENVRSARIHYTGIVNFITIALGTLYVAIFSTVVDLKFKILLLIGIQILLIALVRLHVLALKEFKEYSEIIKDQTTTIYIKYFRFVIKLSYAAFLSVTILNAIGFILLLLFK